VTFSTKKKKTRRTRKVKAGGQGFRRKIQLPRRVGAQKKCLLTIGGVTQGGFHLEEQRLTMTKVGPKGPRGVPPKCVVTKPKAERGKLMKRPTRKPCGGSAGEKRKKKVVHNGGGEARRGG